MMKKTNKPQRKHNTSNSPKTLSPEHLTQATGGYSEAYVNGERIWVKYGSVW